MRESFVRRHVAVLVVGIAVLAWAVSYVVRLGPVETRVDDSIARARAELAACLLDRPTEPWKLEDRLRRIDIAATGDPSSADWPMRCRAQASALEQLLESPETPFLGNDTASARLYRGRLYENLRVAREITELLRPVEGEADVDWPAVDVAPPPPVELVTEPTPWPKGPSRAAGGRSDLVVLMQRAVCRFAARERGLESVARCTYFPDAFGDAPRVHGLVVGPVGELALLTPHGPVSLVNGESSMIAELEGTGAWSWVGRGELAGMTRDDLVIRGREGSERRLAFDRPSGVARDTAWLVGDHLMWTEEGTLFARTVSRGELGPVVEVGRPRVPSAPFAGPDAHCSYGDVSAVWVESDPSATPIGSEYRIAAHFGDRWVLSDPVRGRLDCLPDAVVVTHVKNDDSGSSITRTVCVPTGCDSATIELPDVTERAEAAPLGDRMIVVWADDLVRARIDRFPDLPQATTMALFDGYGDHRHYEYGGQSVIHRIVLHVRGESAIVELHTDDTIGIHVASDGAARPVRVVYE